MGNRSGLVGREVNDADEGVHCTVAFVHKHLLHRLLGGLEVKVRLDQKALGKIKVPSLEVTVRHFDALGVRPFDGQVVQRLVEEVAQQRFPARLEVGFVHRNHGHTSGLAKSPSFAHKHFPDVEPPLRFHWRIRAPAWPRLSVVLGFLSPSSEGLGSGHMRLFSHHLT